MTTARATTAAAVTRLVNDASRRLKVGSGTVIGGRAGLAVDPELLAHGLPALGRGSLRSAIVSGTNGKTTTTRLLAVGLRDSWPPTARCSPTPPAPTCRPATSPPWPAARPRAPAVLEVDEGYLPRQVADLVPAVVVLTNLSRDQLDRTNEVRMLAARWRAGTGRCRDDAWWWPTPTTRWWCSVRRRGALEGDLGGGRPAPGEADAAGTTRPAVVASPSLLGTLVVLRLRLRSPHARPRRGGRPPMGGTSTSVFADGRRLPGSRLALPGPVQPALTRPWPRWRPLRYSACRSAGGLAAMGHRRRGGWPGGSPLRQVCDGVATRLLLAKNPAGWSELGSIWSAPGSGPVVVS